MAALEFVTTEERRSLHILSSKTYKNIKPTSKRTKIENNRKPISKLQMRQNESKKTKSKGLFSSDVDLLLEIYSCFKLEARKYIFIINYHRS